MLVYGEMLYSVVIYVCRTTIKPLANIIKFSIQSKKVGVVMSIRKKLNLGFIFLIALLLIASMVSFIQFKATQNNLEEVLKHRIVQIELTEKIRQQLASQGLFLRSYILNNKDATAKENLERYEKQLPKTVEELSAIVRSDYTKNIMQEITELQNELLTHSVKARQAFEKGRQI